MMTCCCIGGAVVIGVAVGILGVAIALMYGPDSLASL